MTEEVKALFDGIKTMVFAFPDGSVVTSRVTLNPDILAKHGFSDVDGFVDLDVGKPIPQYMFEHLAGIDDEKNIKLSEIHVLFNLGGKVSW